MVGTDLVKMKLQWCWLLDALSSSYVPSVTSAAMIRWHHSDACICCRVLASLHCHCPAVMPKITLLSSIVTSFCYVCIREKQIWDGTSFEIHRRYAVASPLCKCVCYSAIGVTEAVCQVQGVESSVPRIDTHRRVCSQWPWSSSRLTRLLTEQPSQSCEVTLIAHSIHGSQPRCLSPDWAISH